jgi:putative endopeptidase
MTVRAAWLAAASVAVLLSACNRQDPAAAPKAPASASAPQAAAGKPQYGTFGFDTAGMDASVAAGDDFFRYANGKWVDRTEIPADRSSLTSFAVLTEQASTRTRAIIEEAAAANAAEGTETRKIGDYYARPPSRPRARCRSSPSSTGSQPSRTARPCRANSAPASGPTSTR